MDDDAKWKRRFYLYTAARLFGLLVFFAGMAVFFTDLLRAGGWPAVGVILMILGLVDAVAVPKLLKDQWQREDREV